MEWMPLPLCVPNKDVPSSETTTNEDANGRVPDGCAGLDPHEGCEFCHKCGMSSICNGLPRLPAPIAESGILPIACAAREAVPTSLALLGQQPNTLRSVAIP